MFIPYFLNINSPPSLLLCFWDFRVHLVPEALLLLLSVLSPPVVFLFSLENTC